MPLVHENTRDAIGENIRRLHAEGGKSQKQSIAIALDIARRSAAQHRAGGGFSAPSPSLAERSYLRSEDSRPFSGGLINSSVAGRTDRHNLDVPAGSYVLPADVVSGLGEGNTMAGADVLKKMFGTGPYGMTLHGGSGGGGHGIPTASPPPQEAPPPPVHFAGGGAPRLARMTAPSVPTRVQGRSMTAPRQMPPQPVPRGIPATATETYHGGLAGPPMAQSFAMGGGAAEGHENGWVPIVAAGGEVVLPPSVVRGHHLLGRGSLSRGHNILDHFVKMRRAKTIKQLKALPGPAK